MSLNIYIAHTGEHLLADPVAFASPDALRSWIARNTSIPFQRQILMTARGKNVKIQTLATENEIFVYDRRYVSEPENVQFAEIPRPASFEPTDPPDVLSDQNDLHAWRNLYMSRRTWALDLSSRCQQINDRTREHRERTEVINRAVGVALENLKSHVGNLENRFQEAQAWANDLLKEQKAALDGWQRALATLGSIPARRDFGFLARPSTPKADTDPATGTLRDFVEVNEVQRAGSEASNAYPRFSRQVGDIEHAVDEIASDTQRLLDEVLPSPFEENDEWVQEAETIAKKISSDYEHVIGLPKTPKSLANISRLALSHTTDLLPPLAEIGMELQAGLEEAVKRRNAAGTTALNHMRAISAIESRLADTQALIINLDANSEVFDVIYSVFHMPMVYGSVLIESARRHEWNEKMKADASTLAEEMAVFRDEEHRRRKKWLKTMSDYAAVPDSTTLSVEVNLHGNESAWPVVSRKEIEEYLELLTSKPGMTTLVEELSQQYKDLDNPTRQQRRRAKAFKQGSVYDMGRSSLLLRGDDMVRSLRDEKTKLAEKLRGSESRVRKLEDLLHRQGSISRPVSGNFSLDFPVSPASPHPDQLSRRSSASSRRMSSNQSPEDRALVQRIVQLEAELAAERDSVQRLQKEAYAERQTTTDRIEEVQSTKKDLIDNLEARRREFDEERRFLEAEMKRLRVRTEELEDELDRAIDGREHEKNEVEDRIRQMESEMQKVRDGAAEESRKAQQLQEDLQSHAAERLIMQRQLEQLGREAQEYQGKEQENHHALQAAFTNLSPGGSMPRETPSLIKAIEVLSEGLAIHAKSAEESATSAASECKMLEDRLAGMEAETGALKRHSCERDSELSRLRAELEAERSKLSSAAAELENERSNLHALRSQVAAGETGSETLRARLAEEEQKFASLRQQLADAEAQSRQFQGEAHALKTKLETLAETWQQANGHFKARGTCAEELSHELFAQVEKLGRMLDQLGFTILRQDGQIVVQRSSKVNGLSGTGENLARSGVVSLALESALLHWLHDGDREEELARFKSFMDAVKEFDVEIFGDAVVKRVRDIEMLARKWQKEARGYREKYHRTQSEAHEKIAYRSFKEGDLALFLPTRNQAIRSWAAFNVGAPHYFLREQDVHKLSTRDWLLARITKIEERVVDLSKSLNGVHPDRRSVASDGTSFDDENPFELSDGLRWYLLDAAEEKPGAPTTPGLGKSTVASAHVDAKGSIRLKRPSQGGNVARTLTKSLDSRRNSSNSKQGVPAPTSNPTSTPALPIAQSSSSGDLVKPAEADAGSVPRETAPIFDEGSAPAPALQAASPPQRDADPRVAASGYIARPAHEDGQDQSSGSPSRKRSPTKSRPWEKLWSMEYRLESADK